MRSCLRRRCSRWKRCSPSSEYPTRNSSPHPDRDRLPMDDDHLKRLFAPYDERELARRKGRVPRREEQDWHADGAS
ncbi:hypothetical protein GCM10010278_75750 [Streptomyces melanogenes]|nr:hypothetical protein GCM10010278_75750 [Streptomyces melanogenes]